MRVDGARQRYTAKGVSQGQWGAAAVIMTAVAAQPCLMEVPVLAAAVGVATGDTMSAT